MPRTRPEASGELSGRCRVPAFRLPGPIVMTLIGVVAALARALADAGIYLRDLASRIQ